MFRLAVILFVLAILAALFGAGGLAGLLFEGAELFLVVGLILFVIAMVFGRDRIFG